jgi:hypothetical protein
MTPNWLKSIPRLHRNSGGDLRSSESRPGAAQGPPLTQFGEFEAGAASGRPDSLDSYIIQAALVIITTQTTATVAFNTRSSNNSLEITSPPMPY